MTSLGFNRVVGVLIPGFLASVAVWLLADRLVPPGSAHDALDSILTSEWRFGFASLMSSALCGSLLRSLLGLIEARWIDARTARKLKIDENQFDEEWDRYVDSLDTVQNPYIANLALTFFFETRGGAATILASLAFGVWSGTWAGWMLAGAGALVGVFMFLSGLRTHMALAEYRHRKFGSPPRSAAF